MTTVTLNNSANKYIAPDEREDYYINAGAGNDTVVGNDGNDTIIGGKGNDSLGGGNGADTFIYALGDGNDTITDYEEDDIIKFTSGTPEFSTNGDNIILTVGSGKITLLNAKDKVITYVDENDVTHIWPETVRFNSAKTKATLLETYNDDSFDINDYGADYAGVKTIDGSAVDQGIYITGNGKANSIVGGSGNDTLEGGKGNDKLYGGEGADLFVYNKGDKNDIILDYDEEDTVQINSTTVTTIKPSADKESWIISLASGGKISLKGAADKVITYVDDTGKHTYPEQQYVVTNEGKTVTLKEDYSNSTFNVADYDDIATTARTIDGSAVDQDLTIIGNSRNNNIIGSAGNNTLEGAGGNDILTGGSGKNVFFYNEGDGNDTITNYQSGDIVKINSGDLSYTATLDGDDYVLYIGEGSIRLTNTKNKYIEVHDAYDNIIWWPEDPLAALSYTKTKVTIGESYKGDSFDLEYFQNFVGKVKTIDATAVDQDIYITGDKQKNSIYGGEGNDTLEGGAGNDVLDGGDGADVFVYNKGDDNDIILNYDSEDTIQINSTTVVTDKIAQKGDDIIFTLASGGKISLKAAADKVITYIDDDGEHTYPDTSPVIYNKETKATSATLTSVYSEESFGPSEYSAYKSSLVSIDASAVDDGIYITGNAKANSITGGSGNDTLEGGKGNDKLYGGDGADVFVYNKGDKNDIILDYDSEDTIQINSTTVVADKIAQKGDDIIFTLASGGKISLKGAADKVITYIDDDGEHTYPDTSPVVYNKETKATSATLTSAYSEDSFGPSEYSAHKSSLVSIDASAVDHEINITGNAKNNVITGGSDSDYINGGNGADTLNGGEGNDTLTGGKGNDVFVYNSGEGNDVITDYTKGADKIQFDSGTIINEEDDVGVDDDGNVVFTVGNGTLTLENVGDQKITYIDATGEHEYIREPFTANTAKTSVTIRADYSDETFDIGDYGSAYNKVKTIDATQVTADLSIIGNGKANIIKGGDGDNYIDGAAGNDKLYGYEGDDTLVGGNGADLLLGDAGSDSLWGGKGNDTLTGGDDADVFVFGAGEGSDIITDYDSSLDVIVIRSGVVDNVEAKNGAVVFTMTTGETLTLQNAAGKYAEVVDINNRNTILKRYRG